MAFPHLRNPVKSVWAVWFAFGGLAVPQAMGVGLDAASAPFSYCSNGQCRVVEGPLELFFGALPEAVSSACAAQDAYALTFDDGPSDNWPQVLEILAKHQIKATFFVIGDRLQSAEHIALLKRAYTLGHQISNHTFTHANLLELSTEEALKQLDRTAKAITDALGEEPRVQRDMKIVRPPMGYMLQRVLDPLAAHGYSFVRWNADRYDWNLDPAHGATVIQRLQQQLDYIKDHASQGMNSSLLDLNHDFSQATLSSLEEMIQLIHTAGYRFVSVHECITGIIGD